LNPLQNILNAVWLLIHQGFPKVTKRPGEGKQLNWTSQDLVAGCQFLLHVTSKSQLLGLTEITLVTDGSADSQTIFFINCGKPTAFLR